MMRRRRPPDKVLTSRGAPVAAGTGRPWEDLAGAVDPSQQPGRDGGPAMSWWQPALAVASGVLVAYAAAVAALLVSARRHPEALTLRGVLRLLPDLLRLLRALAGDRTLPRGVRVRLVLLLVYLASPIDLVPDVVPVIGYADDVLVVALVLRSVVRRAGREALVRHWAGTAEGLAAVERLAGLRADLPDSRS
jgi:uncharacterized membrane protein YkvA (DUF1232 family)